MPQLEFTETFLPHKQFGFLQSSTAMLPKEISFVKQKKYAK